MQRVYLLASAFNMRTTTKSKGLDVKDHYIQQALHLTQSNHIHSHAIALLIREVFESAYRLPRYQE